MDIQVFTAPLIGAIIGLITNGIAIKMIFRPLRPKYIAGWKLPFTPGLIPKERGRLAKSIGVTISLNLMNKEVLEKSLLSGDMYEKILQAIDQFVKAQMRNTQSLKEFLYSLLSKEDIDTIVLNTKNDLSQLLRKELSNPGMGEQVAHVVVEHALQKVREGLLGAFGIDRFVNLIAMPTEVLLAKNINEMLANHSGQLINDLLTKESDRLLSMRMCDIMANRTTQIDEFKKYALSAYKKIISDYLPQILNTIDISKIVEERINDMDVEEVEKLTLQVMDKELKAIVWLGGLLGLVMGLLNLVIG